MLTLQKIMLLVKEKTLTKKFNNLNMLRTLFSKTGLRLMVF